MAVPVPRKGNGPAGTEAKDKTMIELIFVACMATAPHACEEKSLQFAEQMTPMACMMGAQPQLAQWVEYHPQWTVSKWRCQYVDQRTVRI